LFVFYTYSVVFPSSLVYAISIVDISKLVVEEYAGTESCIITTGKQYICNCFSK